MCSFFNNLFTVTGNTTHSKMGLVAKNFLPIIVFQISLMESEEFRETSTIFLGVLVYKIYFLN